MYLWLVKMASCLIGGPRIPLVSVHKHSVNGPTTALFHPLEHLEVSDSITSPASLTKNPLPTLQSQSVIVECPQKDRLAILNDKLNSCPNNFQNTLSSLTLAQESISKGRDFCPSLTWQAKEWSSKLWLPIETDCAASRSNWLSGCYNVMESNSWFSIKTWSPLDSQNLPKTCCPSLTFSIAESMVKESTHEKKEKTRKNKKTEKPVANYCRKFRLYANSEVQRVLKRWFGCVRYTYNWALEELQKEGTELKYNMFELRKSFVNADVIPENKKFLLDCPKHVRDGALSDLVTAFKANMTVKKKNPDHKFKLTFRSKKDGNAAITIPSDAVKQIIQKNGNEKELTMYPTFLKNVLRLKVRQRDLRLGKALTDIKYDCKMVLDKLGRFYLVIPMHREMASENQGSRWVALDPGCRTFLTAYSAMDGTSTKIGDKDGSKLFRLCLHLDKLPAKKRKRAIKLRLRIRHLVDEMHRKAIRHLLENFDNVLIPIFQVSNMVKKVDRKITKRTVRNMLSWRHYEFRMRLMERARQEGKTVYVIGEEYTTKVCSNCFAVNNKVGGAKVFECCHCGLKADRDAMGSRNIFIKNISVRET